jgi:hypothetical protein
MYFNQKHIGFAIPRTGGRQPARQSYGALVTHLWDPSAVLLHLAQWDAR